MLTYSDLERDRRKFIALTGITPRAFRSLLQAFQAAYEDYHPSTLTLAGARRHRRFGGGRKGALDTLEQKLLFALVYQRIHPAQGLLGAAFGISQTRANRWVHLLLPVLGQACNGWEQFSEDKWWRLFSRELQVQRSSSRNGLQRCHAGLKDLERYALGYRGRDKNHPDKHSVPGNGKLISDLEQPQGNETTEANHQK